MENAGFVQNILTGGYLPMIQNQLLIPAQLLFNWGKLEHLLSLPEPQFPYLEKYSSSCRIVKGTEEN